jgi:hypothetical protein
MRDHPQQSMCRSACVADEMFTLVVVQALPPQSMCRSACVACGR